MIIKERFCLANMIEYQKYDSGSEFSLTASQDSNRFKQLCYKAPDVQHMSSDLHLAASKTLFEALQHMLNMNVHCQDRRLEMKRFLSQCLYVQISHRLLSYRGCKPELETSAKWSTQSVVILTLLTLIFFVTVKRVKNVSTSSVQCRRIVTSLRSIHFSYWKAEMKYHKSITSTDSFISKKEIKRKIHLGKFRRNTEVLHSYVTRLLQTKS